MTMYYDRRRIRAFDCETSSGAIVKIEEWEQISQGATFGPLSANVGHFYLTPSGDKVTKRGDGRFRNERSGELLTEVDETDDFSSLADGLV